MTSHGTLTPQQIEASKTKAAYELKKVQQRTAAIIIFAIAYQCVFALIGVAKVIQRQGRDGDAYGLVFMAGVIALLQTGAIRAVLGKRIFSWIWTPLAILPPIIAAIWFL